MATKKQIARAANKAAFEFKAAVAANAPDRKAKAMAARKADMARRAAGISTMKPLGFNPFGF